MTSTIYVNRWRKKKREANSFCFSKYKFDGDAKRDLDREKNISKNIWKTSGHTYCTANQHSYLYEETRNQTQSHGNYSSCTLDRSRNWRSRYKDNSGFIFLQKWVIRTKVDLSDESLNQSRSTIIIIKFKKICACLCTYIHAPSISYLLNVNFNVHNTHARECMSFANSSPIHNTQSPLFLIVDESMDDW